MLRYGGQGPDVVVLPGITSPALTVEFLALALAERYRVLVPDLRGRGGTDVAGSGEYTLRHYTDDVRALVTELGLSKPSVIGHSLGARIAAAYSVRSGGEHDRLILVDPPLSGPGRAPYPTSRAGFEAQLLAAYRGTTAQEVRAHYPKWPVEQLRIRAQELATCDRTAVLETHDGFHREDFFRYWPSVHPPALLIRGAQSPVVTAGGARELAAANPGVPIVSVDGAGHMVPWDNWPGFRAVLLAYLLDPSTSALPDGPYGDGVSNGQPA